MNLFRKFCGKQNCCCWTCYWRASSNTGSKTLLLLNRNRQRFAGGKLAAHPELGQWSGAETLQKEQISASCAPFTATYMPQGQPVKVLTWKAVAKNSGHQQEWHQKILLYTCSSWWVDLWPDYNWMLSCSESELPLWKPKQQILLSQHYLQRLSTGCARSYTAQAPCEKLLLGEQLHGCVQPCS